MGIKNEELLEYIRETVFMKNYAWEIYEKMSNSKRIRGNLRETLNKCISFVEKLHQYHLEISQESFVNKYFMCNRSLSELKIHDFALFEYSQLFENFANEVKKNIKEILIIYYYEKDNEFKLFNGYNKYFECENLRKFIGNYSFYGKDENFLKNFIVKCNKKLRINLFYKNTDFLGGSGGVINETIKDKLKAIESERKFDLPKYLFQVDEIQKPILNSSNLEDIIQFHKLLNIENNDILFLEIAFGIIFDWGKYREYFRILKKNYPEMFEGIWGLNLSFKKRFEHIIKLNLKIQNFNLKSIDYTNIHLFDTRPTLQEYYKIIREKGEERIIQIAKNQ